MENINKKILVICITIFLIVFSITLIIVLNKSNNNINNNIINVTMDKYDFRLYGDQNITLYQGEEYQEPGYYVSFNGEDVTKKVLVINNIDSNVLGSYQVIYTIDTIKRIRKVNVISNVTIDDITLKLIGDEKITLSINDKYEELGCIALENNKDISSELIIDGEVDTTKAGTYYITYKIYVGNEYKSLQREIEVKEVDKVREIVLELIGKSTITLNQYEKYVEPGYIASYNDEDIKSKVVIDSNVNTSKAGTYYIIYKLNIDGVTKSIKRTIIVKEIISIDDIELELIGDSTVTINQYEIYKDLGCSAYSKISNASYEIIKEGTVNTSKVGTYYITYKVILNGQTKSVKRTVIVKEKAISKELEIALNGNSQMSIMTNESFIDPGCVAYYGGVNVSNDIVKEGTVNTSKAGTYYITYKISKDGQTKSVKRTVTVIEKEDLNISINYNTANTNQNISVSINASGTDFSYILLPNGDKVYSKKTTYNVTQNGIYNFYVYDKNDNYKLKTARISNIDKTLPSGTCVANINNGKTEISVSASDNVGISKYVYNGSYTSNNSFYTINRELSNVYVTVYDVSGNSKNITCSIKENYIEMHFIAGISDDDAILIRTRDKVIMIDGGQYDKNHKVVNYLKDMGITKIDALIGSHVHWNHVQEQAEILENFVVDKVYYSVDILNCVSLGHCKSDDVKYIKDALIKYNKVPTILGPNSYLEIGDMKMYFIGPTRGKFTTYQNANSLVFIMKYGNNKFMFTGDTPEEYMNTEKFLQFASTFNMTIDIDVLKWPHHGYEDLTDEFFQATTPKYAIIPNCCHCSSKYPSYTNKKLMTKYNTTYYQVCDSKNIVLISNGNDITIRTNQVAADYRRS